MAQATSQQQKMQSKEVLRHNSHQMEAGGDTFIYENMNEELREEYEGSS